MSEKFCKDESTGGGCLREKWEGELSLNCGFGCCWYEHPEQEDWDTFEELEEDDEQ